MTKGASSPASEFALTSLSRSGDTVVETAGRLVLLGDADPVEAVHDLRVSIRRVRADLRTFAPVLEPTWLGATKLQLRDLARVVGQARDLDVICVRLEQLVEALPESDRRAADSLLGELRLDRSAALQRALDSLGDRHRAAVITDLALIASRSPLASDADRVAMEDLVAVSRRQWRRLRKSYRAAAAEPSDEALHQVRLRTKTLRYSLSALEPHLHKSARDHVKSLVALQDHLGEMQDAVVIERWLRVARETDRGDAFVLGEFVGLERARKERLRSTWRDQWRRVSRPRLRRWTN